MTQHLRFTCDNCNADITVTTNAVDYRLKLMDELIAHAPDAAESVKKNPNLLTGDKHFCGIWCLYAWVRKTNEHTAG